MKLQPRRVLLVVAALFAALLIGLIASYLYLQAQIPKIRSLTDYRPPQGSHVYSDDGQLVAVFAKERRTVIPVESLPKHVTYAFVAAEDERFYSHQGLDYLGILRAALKNLRPGAHLQGASTITQQTVKALIVGPERTYTRKMREAILARELEQTLTKDGILHLYLNHIYFGSGAYGIEAAARVYFDKSARELDLGEAALLASIPKNPSKYTVRANPAAAKERQIYVLNQMVANNWADKAAADREIAKPAPAPPATSLYFNRLPHYVEQVRRLLIEKYGEQQVMEGGLTIYTGMDARAQLAAQDALRQGLEELARRQGYAGARKRIEVDQFERTSKALHAALNEKLARRTAVDALQSRRLPYVWDLSRFVLELPDEPGDNEPKVEEIGEDGKVVEATAAPVPEAKFLTLTPLTEGARVMALVTKVDSLDGVIWLDLGTAAGRLSLKSLEWARRFSATDNTPAPRDVAEILNRGDLVTVDLVNVPTRLSSDKSKLTVQAELVPVPKAQGTLVAIDPYSRYVRALVGGYDQVAGGLIRAVQSKRQPGSSFKPIVYATGLDTGAMTPASICPDTPIVIRDQWSGKAWKPENYEDGKFDGNITYRTALLRSKNTCSVKLIEKITPAKVIELAHKMGINSELPENMTLALGSGDVTPLELANSYATIASGGYAAPPIFVRKVTDAAGNILEENKSAPEEVLRPAVAFVLADMMRSVVEEGTATKALVLDRPLAGKTGTSNESRNVWFGGFSTELVAVVWVGFDDNAPLGRATGGSTALPIWIRFMGRALEGVPRRAFTPPDNVVFVRVDPDTGRLSTDVGSIEEAFIAGSEPTATNEPLPSIFIEDNPDH